MKYIRENAPDALHLSCLSVRKPGLLLAETLRRCELKNCPLFLCYAHLELHGGQRVASGNQSSCHILDGRPNGWGMSYMMANSIMKVEF